MFSALAPKLRERGWRALIPIRPRDKAPLIPAWQQFNTASPDDGTIEAWRWRYPHAGVGLAFGPDRVLGIDLDFLEQDKADRARAIMIDTLGPTDLIRIGRPPKLLAFFRDAEGLVASGKAFGGFELFLSSGQCVIYGIHPFTKQPYDWPVESPETMRPEELPVVRQDQLNDFLEAMRPLRGDVVKLNGAAVGGAGQTSKWLQMFASLADTDAMIRLGVAGIGTASVGTRHSTMIAVVTALTMRGVSPDEFQDAIEEAYLRTLDKSEAARRRRAVEDAIRWADRAIWGGHGATQLPNLKSPW